MQCDAHLYSCCNDLETYSVYKRKNQIGFENDYNYHDKSNVIDIWLRSISNGYVTYFQYNNREIKSSFKQKRGWGQGHFFMVLLFRSIYNTVSETCIGYLRIVNSHKQCDPNIIVVNFFRSSMLCKDIMHSNIME